jgi:hypothetical protein
VRELALVVRRLEEHGCRPRGSEERGYSALCPICRRKKRSLSAGANERRDRVVLQCHAGCPTGAILRELGLEWRDLFATTDEIDAEFSKKRAGRNLLNTPESPGFRTQTSSVSVVSPEAVVSHGCGEVRRHEHAVVTPTPTPEPTPTPKPGGLFPTNTGDSGSPERSGKTGEPVAFGDEAERLFRQVADYENGRIAKPDIMVPLAIGNLPPQAKTLRGLAAKLAVIGSYRLTDGDAGWWPVSGSFAAWLMGLDPDLDARRGRKWLDALVRYRVLREGEPLEKLGKGDGTRTFKPYGYELEVLLSSPAPGGASGAEGDPGVEVVGEPELDPVVEVGEQDAVERAVVDELPAGSVGMVAAGDGAESPGFHAPHSMLRRGGPSAKRMFDPG